MLLQQHFVVTVAQLLVSTYTLAVLSPHPDFEQLDYLPSLLDLRPQGNTQISSIGLSTKFMLVESPIGLSTGRI